MTDLVFVVIGMGSDTNLKPAFLFNRSRHAASNCSLETFSGSPNRLPELSNLGPYADLVIFNRHNRTLAECLVYGHRACTGRNGLGPINALASSEAEGPALTPSIRQTALERSEERA